MKIFVWDFTDWHKLNKYTKVRFVVVAPDVGTARVTVRQRLREEYAQINDEVESMLTAVLLNPIQEFDLSTEQSLVVFQECISN